MHVVPIPVQGAVVEQIRQRLREVIASAAELKLEAIVLARGGGSREDLAVFDDELLARDLAACPIPVVTGLGHEDDTTVADLVADYRAATPTAAIVALLPDRGTLQLALQQRRALLKQLLEHRLLRERGLQEHLRQRLQQLHPLALLERQRERLQHRQELLAALSPQRLLERGYALVRTGDGRLLRSTQGVRAGADIQLELQDGKIDAVVERVHAQQ